MADDKLLGRLKSAQNLAEVKEILQDHPEINAEQVWREIEKHRSGQSEKLDLNELDAVSGGADRDWVKDGCAATCEPLSWCGSNDYCMIWDVTYDNFWAKCPDGHDHVWQDDVCTRCGFRRSHVPGGDPG